MVADKPGLPSSDNSSPYKRIPALDVTTYCEWRSFARHIRKVVYLESFAILEVRAAKKKKKLISIQDPQIPTTSISEIKDHDLYLVTHHDLSIYFVFK